MNEEKTIQVAWAVEFGTSAIRRIRLTRTPDGYRADRYVEAPLPARWTMPTNLSAAAAQLPAEEIGDSPEASDPLVACVGNDLVLYRTIQLPRADEATLEKMIHSQLETLLPAQMEKFAVAWKTQADPTDANLQHVMLAAVRRESLATITNICTRWRKDGADVTPALSALANTWAELSGSNEPVLLMDIGARSTAIALVQARRIRRCAVIDTGGDAWTEQIAESLGISCEEAERRKHQASDEHDTAVQDILDEVMFTWSNGIKEAYNDSLAGVPDDARPTRCVIFGRAGRLASIAKRVSMTLGIPAAVVQTPDALRLEDGIELDTVGSLVGAAIGAMQDDSPLIRLACGKEDKPAGLKRKRWHWTAAAGWLIAATALLYGLDLYDASRAENTVDTVYQETRQRGGLNRQSAMGEFLENGAPAPLDMMEQITKAAPDSTILTSLTYARSGLVSLQGSVANEKEYQDFLNKLTELGKTDPRRAWPDKGRFRFELNLTFKRSFIPTTRPTTQPAKKSATQPQNRPATAPTSVPASAPATGPVGTPASQPASQPAGGGA